METPTPTQGKSKMNHDEFVTKLDEKVKNLKGGLDALLAAKKLGNAKQVAYWVGKNARDLTELSKLCMGEVVAERLAQGRSGGIIT